MNDKRYKELAGLHREAKRIWGRFSTSLLSHPAVDPEIELYQTMFRYFQVGKSYYFIFNLKEAQFDFLSPEIKDVLGYNNTIDVDSFLDKIHPEDRPNFIIYEDKYAELLASLPADQVARYKLSYDFRVKNKYGKYVRILHQVSIVEYTDEKEIFRMLCVHTDISHLKRSGPSEITFIGLKGAATLYHQDIFPDMEAPRQSALTKKEKEILCYIEQGLTSKEIAATLSISIHTVNNHRKNMLRKTNNSSIHKLIEKEWGMVLAGGYVPCCGPAGDSLPVP